MISSPPMSFFSGNVATRMSTGLALPSFDDVVAAGKRIADAAVRTPLLEFPELNAVTGGRILVKPESLQRMGSFKFRGAYNAISQLDRSTSPGGVTACSSGNHAQGVAEAARLCGLAAAIVMPSDAPRLKLARTRGAGAEVVTYDRVTENREEIASRLARERGASFVPPYDHPHVIAGQGTVGLEIVEQAQKASAEIDGVLVPCGGGGLVAGVGLAVRHELPRAELFAVEPAGFDDHARSLASGRRERNDALGGSLCDALLAPTPGELTFALNRAQLAGALVVTDEEAKAAVRFAFEMLKLVVEPGGAVALAALLAGRLPAKGRTIAIVLSGGNVDPEIYAAILGERSS